MTITIQLRHVKLATNPPKLSPETQSNDDSHLHAKLGHLIRRLHQNMVATFAEKLAGFDITNVQFAALEAISRLEQCTQKDIADFIAMEPSNMHALLRRLSERGFISIGPDRLDSRRNLVQLTKSGIDLLEDMRPRESQVQPALLSSLSGKEQEQFMRLIKKLV